VENHSPPKSAGNQTPLNPRELCPLSAVPAKLKMQQAIPMHPLSPQKILDMAKGIPRPAQPCGVLTSVFRYHPN
jgi:hypothetical protein